jgi:hypothetical protein
MTRWRWSGRSWRSARRGSDCRPGCGCGQSDRSYSKSDGLFPGHDLLPPCFRWGQIAPRPCTGSVAGRAPRTLEERSKIRHVDSLGSPLSETRRSISVGPSAHLPPGTPAGAGYQGGGDRRGRVTSCERFRHRLAYVDPRRAVGMGDSSRSKRDRTWCAGVGSAMTPAAVRIGSWILPGQR